MDVSKNREFFLACFHEKFPDLTLRGKPIANSNEFCEVIRTSEWTKQIKQMVAYASFEMWGHNNQFAINFEGELCKMLRIKFTGKKSNGELPLKIHQGNCFANIGVKCKGTLVCKIRNTCKKRHSEACYSRKEKCAILEENATTMGAVVDQDGKAKIPKLVSQRMATLEKDGFHGKIGICEGHPSFMKQDPRIAEKPTTLEGTVATNTSRGSDVSPLTEVTTHNESKKEQKKLEALMKESGLSEDQLIAILLQKRGTNTKQGMGKDSRETMAPMEQQAGDGFNNQKNRAAENNNIQQFEDQLVSQA